MRQSFFDYCRQYHKEALLREWDTARNAPLTPQAVTYGSHTPVWWRCENGHEWEAVVYTRTHGSGCPFCAGKKAQAGFNDLATQYPELARQWDYTKNIPVLPADVTTGSHRLVWWKCEKGHSWRASVRSRVSGNGCPVCAGRQLLAGENDLATRFPELAQEWDRQKNGTLTPESAIPGSSRRVWWRCKAVIAGLPRFLPAHIETAGVQSVPENWCCPASMTLRHKIRCLPRSGMRNETERSHRSRSR